MALCRKPNQAWAIFNLFQNYRIIVPLKNLLKFSNITIFIIVIYWERCL